MGNQGRALEYALEALFTVRAGWSRDDRPLILRAIGIYGLALQELQKALRSNLLVVDKSETLAACMTLALYEVSLTIESMPIQCLNMLRPRNRLTSQRPIP